MLSVFLKKMFIDSPFFDGEVLFIDYHDRFTIIACDSVKFDAFEKNKFI